jgi:hypothetical protein
VSDALRLREKHDQACTSWSDLTRPSIS